MAITAAAGTLDARYAASGAVLNAHIQLEGLNLTSNAAELPATEVACAAALNKLAAAGASAVAVGSTNLLVKSGVEFLAPAIGGVYVNGYTLTIVDGLVTAINAS